MSDVDTLRIQVPAPAEADPASTPPRPQLSAVKLALREARLRGEHRAAPLAPRPRGGDLPLSFAQERFWFLERLQPGLALSCIAGAERLPGPVHAPTLERALAEVVRRHETLRTVFHDVDGAPVQRILPPGPFPLAFRLTAANTHDSRLFEEVIDAVPPVRQGRGRPSTGQALRR